MQATITRFGSLTDVHGVRCELSSWGELVAHPVTTETKETSGWSPALFERSRRGAAVITVAALVLDHDDGTTLDRIAEIWGDSWALVHSSWSHTREHPKFRVILPFDRPASASEHAILWRWAFARDPQIDQACKDAGRFWFVPSHRPGAAYEWRELGGAVLVVDRIKRDCERPLSRPAPSFRPNAGQPSALTRARAYVARVPGAVSGQGGHLATFKLALALVRGFDLDPSTALNLLLAWNESCEPPWTEKELVHKIKSAGNVRDVSRGYLLDAPRRVA